MGMHVVLQDFSSMVLSGLVVSNQLELDCFFLALDLGGVEYC